MGQLLLSHLHVSQALPEKGNLNVNASFCAAAVIVDINNNVLKMSAFACSGNKHFCSKHANLLPQAPDTQM